MPDIMTRSHVFSPARQTDIGFIRKVFFLFRTRLTGKSDADRLIVRSQNGSFRSVPFRRRLFGEANAKARIAKARTAKTRTAKTRTEKTRIAKGGSRPKAAPACPTRSGTERSVHNELIFSF